ncbi:multicopper oxidase family protein [Thiohalobacter sp. IOR34]|uniref:multicopper oxidase family protein n=1 Tax=Thiohalobacter sp. IOR34 TaxID=3057176 RepID=UPI0025B0B99E|nr:multicopper oxidase family protein [Thiohalobacter sp. IOR34]WJW76371.1 multicopper oxidase family protein [Thiohalobacter sp. IOR34]
MLTIHKQRLMMRGGMGGGGGGTGGGSTGGSGGGRTFSYLASPTSVSARMNGSLTMADGASLRTWYFGGGFNGDRALAGPVLEANEGETVQITLSSMMPHTIHFHGLDVDQANDGVPSTSGYVGRSMGGGGFGRVGDAPSLGTSYTYTFVAPHAGTYMYHCHVDTVLHFEMGMYGTVIIRPADGSTNVAWAGGPTFDKEYIWQLGSFDSSWHGEMVSGAGTVRYRPDYFMINGRDGANAASDPTVAVSAGAGQTVLIRVNGTSYMPAMIRLGGLPFQVIASDGRPLPAPITVTEQLVCAGERYDLLLTLPNSGQYQASVDYYDIRRARLLGSVNTTLTVV